MKYLYIINTYGGVVSFIYYTFAAEKNGLPRSKNDWQRFLKD